MGPSTDPWGTPCSNSDGSMTVTPVTFTPATFTHRDTYPQIYPPR